MTQRSPGIDKDLLSAARKECLEVLQRVSEVVGERVIKMVRGDREKACEVCGEEFTATRRDSKTCSDGCRQKAYRGRRKEAQQDR
jgi:predicted nucleic acid-binding Zn ribbon protein